MLLEEVLAQRFPIMKTGYMGVSLDGGTPKAPKMIKTVKMLLKMVTLKHSNSGGWNHRDLQGLVGVDFFQGQQNLPKKKSKLFKRLFNSTQKIMDFWMVFC